MPKLIAIPSFVLAVMLVISTPLGAQTCRSEAQIPSSTPTAAFVDHGDGTVTDSRTGLMWMKCPLGLSGAGCATGSAQAYTWRQALEAAQGSRFAGYDDWRLPNIKELSSLVERRCYGPAINLEVFPGMGGDKSYVWSSSPGANDSDGAWNVEFKYGFSAGIFNRDYAFGLRLVRSGQ